VGKAVQLLKEFEYSNFLVGTELPSKVAEREDEFRAEFEVAHGENMRNEFGRLIGKEIARQTGKDVEFRRPEMVVLVRPFQEHVSLQANPLFVSGRYRKLVRDIPQSKWFCSTCHGKGCEKCGWTGKMYKESVQEIIEEPFLNATRGLKASFHASGREDIDARMLGRGRPFVIEITRPQKRFVNLGQLQKEVNARGKGKVQVSGMKFADKTVVRKLKKGESTQKEYRVLIEFEKPVTLKDLRCLKEALTNTIVKQQTPLRVVHRRADMIREKYIYEVNVKKLSPKKAEMKIRCQGGLYVKELVTGDEGRTNPSVSAILSNKAKPMKLDVLNVLIED
jgi:tRNA pseudouridine synthase 10